MSISQQVGGLQDGGTKVPKGLPQRTVPMRVENTGVAASTNHVVTDCREMAGHPRNLHRSANNASIASFISIGNNNALLPRILPMRSHARVRACTLNYGALQQQNPISSVRTALNDERLTRSCDVISADHGERVASVFLPPPRSGGLRHKSRRVANVDLPAG